MPFHPVFVSFLALLLDVLELKCQVSNENPFESHAANIRAFLLSALIYAAAFAANIHTQNANYSRIYSHVGRISGLLSASSVISILLPSHGRLVFILWAFVSVMVSRDLFHQTYLWMYQRVMSALVQLLNTFYGALPQNLEQQRWLPV